MASLLQDSAKSLHHTRGRADLNKKKANHCFQKQAKSTAKQLTANGIPKEFLKISSLLQDSARRLHHTRGRADLNKEKANPCLQKQAKSAAGQLTANCIPEDFLKSEVYAHVSYSKR